MSRYQKRPGWSRDPSRDRLFARYFLTGTDFYCERAPHPTALWPWFGANVHGGPMILSPSGRAFANLNDAQAATEEAARLAGQWPIRSVPPALTASDDGPFTLSCEEP
jgi:hypothetical protein